MRATCRRANSGTSAGACRRCEFHRFEIGVAAGAGTGGAGAWLVALVKPQFEVGRGNIGKGGIVRDEAARNAALDGIVAWLSSVHGWSVIGHMESPIEGGDGNREFLVAARKS
jgi:23S rRNA (cytidine1920-2'-O)/16S rRNA (cytidine1409-2'-O)-methyltransferase